MDDLRRQINALRDNSQTLGPVAIERLYDIVGSLADRVIVLEAQLAAPSEEAANIPGDE